MPELSIASLFQQFINGFFIPHANAFQLGTFLGLNVYDYFYMTFFIAAVVSLLWYKKGNLVKILFSVGMIIFVLALFFQTISQSQFFQEEFKTFHNKSVLERNAILLGSSYFFLKRCRDSLQGYHRAELITDMDMTRPAKLYWQRAISYHLYPIDIRFREDTPIDAIVAFRKNNAQESIPDNFRVVVSWDQNNLLAVREDILK